jgi:hypothetical protein
MSKAAGVSANDKVRPMDKGVLIIQAMYIMDFSIDSEQNHLPLSMNFGYFYLRGTHGRSEQMDIWNRMLPDCISARIWLCIDTTV